MVQLAVGSPCCADYAFCPVWRKEKERLWNNKQHHRASMNARTDGSGDWENA